LENTHILFFADHGETMGSHGMFRKVNPYDEAIRTPMLLSGGLPPYSWRKGRVPVVSNHVDIAPTTLGLCGIPKPDWMRGADYSHLRIPKTAAGPAPDSAYLQNVIPVGHPDTINTPYRGLVTSDGWKYVCFENLSWLMFNLNEDPYEEANLAQNNAFRAERKKLLTRLKQWVADTGDKFTIPEA
jgi:arylsulfatase A-like enzyme